MQLRQVKHLLDYIIDGADLESPGILHDQVARLVTAHGPITMLSLKTTSARRSAYPDGPLPLEATVTQHGEAIGELLLWVDGGFLNTLEFAWWSDDVPTELPTTEAVVVSPRVA
ncbi:MAG: hypothetical protein AAGC66_03545 [Leifsonia sp.]